ncbi:aminotransferase class IV [Fulvivirgaceae bacterium BMA10]|uniref:branched-chain-amino-acid transaminase n=1 Tax=Splendidivirga corallicola TaxID=3051826 RepID=A0ABT8KGJ8_9BACT|nr:aminotransferase class IV [Fulvivirgaceae bacterium BMA10]
MSKYYLLNDRIVPGEEARLHVSDLSILRGYGVFDFFRTHQGIPLFIDDYIRRFMRSAELFGLDHPYHPDFIKQKIEELINLNGYQESGIKLVMTGGYSENGYIPTKSNFVILINDLKLPGTDVYQNGVKILTHLYTREFPEVKSINYITSLMLLKKCQEEGAVEVLYHNGEIISELSRSNFFIVKNKVIITPDQGILSGITRSKILHLAREHYEVEERSLRLDEISGADEAFITSTLKRLMPVVKIDNHLIRDGKPGSVTKDLSRLFSDFEDAYVAGISKNQGA